MTSRKAAWSTGLALAAMGLIALALGQACQGPQQSAKVPAPGAIVPGSTPPSPAAAPASTHSASANPASVQYDLQRAVPLLARPELQPAMEALQNDEPQIALRVAREAFHKVQPGAREYKRWRYLLAYLSEGAGDLAAALEAYEAVAKEPWALSGYARLAAARVRLRMGDAQGALNQAQQIAASAPLSLRADALVAEAATLVGNHDLAMLRRAAYLSAVPLPEGWQTIALDHSRMQIERAETEAAKRKPVAEGDAPGMILEAIHWLQVLRRQPTADLPALEALLARAVQLLPIAQRGAALRIPVEDRFAEIDALLVRRDFEQADSAAQKLVEELRAQPFSDLSCEARLRRSKALSGLRQWGKAVDLLSDASRRCANDDFRARASYSAGKSAFSDKRYSAAIAFFSAVEANKAQGTLGDDARLWAALAHQEMGDNAQFVDLLTRMPADYPEGDMSREGVFRLALTELGKRDYSPAIGLLERATNLPETAGNGEQLGREQYFLARARFEVGEKEAGLAGLEALIEMRPLSYYMLHAFSRLSSIDESRASAAIARGRLRATQEAFVFERSFESSQPAFERALELLQVGDLNSANGELKALGIDTPSAAPSLLWGVALLYHQLGAARLCHQLASDLKPNWLSQWPAGPWQQAWQLAYPQPYAKAVAQNSEKNGVAPSLIYAIMREESAFDPKAVSGANALGLMQLLESTARVYSKQVGLPASALSLLNPQVNIAYGSHVLAAFAAKFPQNKLLAIPGYNAGPGRPKRWIKDLPSADFDLWIELIPFRETRNYTKRVLASRAAYAYLYEKLGDESLKLPLQVEN